MLFRSGSGHDAFYFPGSHQSRGKAIGLNLRVLCALLAAEPYCLRTISLGGSRTFFGRPATGLFSTVTNGFPMSQMLTQMSVVWIWPKRCYAISQNLEGSATDIPPGQPIPLAIRQTFACRGGTPNLSRSLSLWHTRERQTKIPVYHRKKL